MNRHTRTVGAAAAALALTATVAGCSTGSAGDGDGGETTTVTVGTLKGQPHLFHPFFYEELAAEGVEFDVIQFDTSPDIKNAVVSGSVDFGVTGVPAALSGVAVGEDVKVVASAADGGTGIVGLPEIDGVEDLAGRTVGYPQGASQEILLRLTLEAHGIEIDDLELVNLPFSDMANALASGQIDAFSSAELGPSIAKQDGAVDVVDPYETPVGRVNIGLITTQRMIDEDPETVQAVVDTHVAATEHMVDNPEEWADGVVEQFGLDAAVVETALGNIWPRWELDAEYRDQVTALTEEMHALGYLDAAPSAEDVFDTTFVDATS
ncbi:NrtA/SsuA/CpmA family ABC transporter substrate-binding protein [Actinotalea sp. BY-33]|uniref:NrtA/SsuA/CpmA family ABC transporter substrate-binding protein n=1 Tax=Actinotalea soli TaxID=2819234 RepID=A0A939LT56_9CELL|nr:NrtA/SsuA/CpmA family ABC transporter substrate-binding protein [Actinotalea soli]MBO1752235.1 NrtA/SsuA/CpmA family ABC transporter substrate-binding protein [Actinotalea soli]